MLQLPAFGNIWIHCKQSPRMPWKGNSVSLPKCCNCSRSIPETTGCVVAVRSSSIITPALRHPLVATLLPKPFL